MRKEFRFFADRRPFSRVISLEVFTENGDGTVSVAKPIEMEHGFDETRVRGDALMMLSTNESQALMDELWHCGVRPSEGSGSAGAMAATQTHLKDMQNIAFSLLEKVTK